MNQPLHARSPWEVAASFLLPGMLLHYGKQDGVHLEATLLLGFCVLYVAIEPRRAWPRLVLAAAILYLATCFPRQANHANAIVVCTVLLAAIWFTSPTGVREVRAATAARAFACTLYGAAAFAKLNSDFFDPQVSCAVEIASRVLRPLLNRDEVRNWVGDLLPALVVLIEVAIPALLAWTKTWKAGFVLALGFHAAVGMAGITDFGLFMLSLLVMGAPTEVRLRLQGSWHLRYLQASSVAAVLVYWNIVGNAAWTDDASTALAGALVASGFAATGMAVCSPIVSAQAGRQAPNFRNVAAAWCILMAWLIQPYIGLSNAGVMTMFSNLSTHSQHSNHLVLSTRHTKIFGLEEDAVTIVAIDPQYRFVAQTDLVGASIPVSEFATSIQAWTRSGTFAVHGTVSYGGQRFELENLYQLSYALERWWHRFTIFRPTHLGSKMTCIW